MGWAGGQIYSTYTKKKMGRPGQSGDIMDMVMYITWEGLDQLLSRYYKDAAVIMDQLHSIMTHVLEMFYFLCTSIVSCRTPPHETLTSSTNAPSALKEQVLLSYKVPSRNDYF